MLPVATLQMATNAPIEHRFDPYEDNGGTSLAIAGEDYCVIAADTRQSTGYSINSRYSPKAFAINSVAVLATTGFRADGNEMLKMLKTNLAVYKSTHGREMSLPALAQLTSTLLYGRRFFPLYTFNILGGLDTEGKGAVYSYDPVGSFEREAFRAGGSASALIQPFLDSQVGRKNRSGPADTTPIPLEDAIKLAKDAFTSAAERDIYTGDQLEIFVVTKEGIRMERFNLRKD